MSIFTEISHMISLSSDCLHVHHSNFSLFSTLFILEPISTQALWHLYLFQYPEVDMELNTNRLQNESPFNVHLPIQACEEPWMGLFHFILPTQCTMGVLILI